MPFAGGVWLGIIPGEGDSPGVLLPPSSRELPRPIYRPNPDKTLKNRSNPELVFPVELVTVWVPACIAPDPGVWFTWPVPDGVPMFSGPCCGVLFPQVPEFLVLLSPRPLMDSVDGPAPSGYVPFGLIPPSGKVPFSMPMGGGFPNPVAVPFGMNPPGGVPFRPIPAGGAPGPFPVDCGSLFAILFGGVLPGGELPDTAETFAGPGWPVPAGFANVSA